MELEYGAPLRPWRREETRRFLAREGLDYDESIQFTVNLLENDEIVASGSLDGAICKCIAVADEHQGEGLTATILTQLRQEAFRRGLRHLYTKPKNRRMFQELSFYPVAETADTLLMENVKDGCKKFVASLKAPACAGTVGAIVANCNPFTLGHRYLVEQAAKQCELLHLFILSEDRSLFPAETRLALAKAGTADLPNVLVHPTGDYLEIFAACFAPALHITRRFVGTEPLSPVTDAYNRQLMAFLPGRGVEVTLIPRKEQDGAPISASRVRALLAEGRVEETRSLVPPATFAYLQAHFPQK